MFSRLVVVVVVLALTGCANRNDSALIPPQPDVSLQQIYVATNRAIDDGHFGTGRGDLRYGRYMISVPSDRRTGQVPMQFGPADPQKHFTTAARQIFSKRDTLGQSIRKDLKQLPIHNREVLVYVHGFNNTFNDGVFRMAQIAEDLDILGVAAHFSWPSSGNPLGYAYDRDSVLFARDDLEQFLTDLAASGATEILLLGHSMGSLLVVETLRQIALRGKKLPILGVVLISPDIDKDVFLKQAEMIPDLPQPFALFVSERDRALALAARLTGQRARLGNLNDVGDLGALPVTILDISQFDDSGFTQHMGPLTSPSLIRLLGQARAVNQSFNRDPSGRAGLLPGTIITFQNATEIVLSPLNAGPL